MIFFLHSDSQLGQPIPTLGQDVVMQDAFPKMEPGLAATAATVGGHPGAVAAAATGKKFFPKKFGGVCKRS